MPIKKFSDGSEVELKDTSRLQLKSLINFAETFGYEYNYNGGFDSMIRSCDTKSLATVQRWHNDAKDPRALGRLVKKAKLQWDKKKRQLKVVDHQIEFI